MLKACLLAALCAAGLASAMPVAPAFAAADAQAGLSAADQDKVGALQMQVEDLIVAHAGDPEALKAAIEALATGAGVDPALAGKAIIAALTHPKGEAARRALADHPVLKTAAGEGLGAAIASIATDRPGLATAMQADVAACGDMALASSVATGAQSATASVRHQHLWQQARLPKDSTPETPASAN
ncbi:MAG TPA: hypothetical protein VGN05_09400 [Parvibaculum sp.]|jgi:hypothetical protein